MSYEGVTNLESEMVPVGTAESLNVQTLVVTPAALATGATHALVAVKTAAVHVTLDGSDPADGGAGIPLAANTLKVWTKEMVAALRLIRGAGSNAVVVIQGLTPRG